MEPIRKALWYIESHFGAPIGLDEIADASGLSRFHFSRSFAQEIGVSPTTYLRGRRLTRAARALADGAPDILSVALDAGYASHEAFTRAFRDTFGATPEDVRAAGVVDHLSLQEPFVMTAEPQITLPDPVFAEAGPFLLAGIREFRTFDERSGIPEQWQRFTPFIGNVPGQAGFDAYGVCLAPSNGREDGFDYIAAVPVRSLDDLPDGLSGLRLSKRRYAQFTHNDHVSKIGATCSAIFGEWTPRAGAKLETNPLFLLEHYTSAFNPQTGVGGMEVWVPLQT